MRLVDDIGTWAEWAATVGLIVFVVQYSLLAPWWRDRIGRTVVFLDLVTLALIIPSDIGTIWPAWSFLHGIGYVWFEDAILALIAVAMAWRITVWQKEALARRRGS